MAFSKHRDKSQSIFNMRHRFHRMPLPTVLHYGDSILTNFKRWMHNNHPKHGPRPLDKKVLKHQHFCAVGGSRYATIHDRTQGIKAPDTQPYRGNLWKYTNDVKELQPDFCLL